MKKEIKARIQAIIGTGLSHEQLLEKIDFLDNNNKRLDAMLAVIHGGHEFSDSPEIKTRIKNYNDNMHNRMLYSTLKKYYTAVMLSTKGSNKPGFDTTNYSQPSA